MRASGVQTPSRPMWSAQLHQLLLPTASSDVDALLWLTRVCTSPPLTTLVARRTDADFVLMRFDLSALSGMAPISRALFRYTVQNPGDAAEMHEFRRSWNANNVTYNNLPMPTPPLPFSCLLYTSDAADE